MDELIDPVTYFSKKDNGLSLIDPCIIDIIQFLRDKYTKPLTINEWWIHLPIDLKIFDPASFLGVMQAKKVKVWSGIRTNLCEIGAVNSAHRLRNEKIFRAFDIRDNNSISEELLLMKIVRENAKDLYNLGLRRVEDVSMTNGWLHGDTLNKNCQENSIRVIDKKKCTETIYF
ncbi:MAG: hypothetical protein ACRCYO_13400 [Bacteroidia bacterium]